MVPFQPTATASAYISDVPSKVGLFIPIQCFLIVLRPYIASLVMNEAGQFRKIHQHDQSLVCRHQPKKKTPTRNKTAKTLQLTPHCYHG